MVTMLTHVPKMDFCADPPKIPFDVGVVVNGFGFAVGAEEQSWVMGWVIDVGYDEPKKLEPHDGVVPNSVDPNAPAPFIAAIPSLGVLVPNRLKEEADGCFCGAGAPNMLGCEAEVVS